MKPGWLKRNWRTLAVGVVIAGVAGSAVALRQRPITVRPHVIDAGDVRREAIGTGSLESDATVVLAFTAAGRIVSIDADEGQSVAEGAVVGTMDLSNVERERSVAAAGVSLASAAVVRAEADIDRAKTARDAAKVELVRTRALYDGGAASRATLDEAQEQLDRAEAELRAAQASRAQGHGGVVVARETVALHARRADDGVLRSPVDGIVVRRHAEPGDVVGVGAPVLTVASSRKVLARVWVDEIHLTSLAEGQEAQVTLRGAGAAPLPARVDRIAPEVDRQTHEVLVELELLARPPRFAFGQRVDARILLEVRRSVPRVPRAACDPGSGACLVEREGRLAAVPVRPGLVGTEHAELLEGLAPGDVIIDQSSLDAPPPLGRRVRRGAP
ncbi:MAG: efflux RND transporter periplasmic adaptor subunit [Polyangiaceae bacterium]|nr:efflux RND transporter periplasmic adaptor subunit [Polyangiaceae bacterium]